MEAVTANQPGQPDTHPDWLSRIIAFIGGSVAWLTLVMVLVTFFVVVCRYAFNLGWIWLQESIVYLHACVFMLAAAWTLQRDEHVRVDIFYRGKSPRHQAWVNLLGTLFFLLPFCIFLLVISWNYVATSWAIQEGSREASGLPWVYVLKSLILVMPALLVLQGGVWLVHNIKTLRSAPSS
ncbi:MAG TPA: TRAP transporter small permease subunit [Xanthomonadales bacterium]|nr:TRAP transporter small permease subunit [Xanthomonadales bacterium]